MNRIHKIVFTSFAVFMLSFHFQVLAREYPMLHYTKETGLPSNTVYNLYRDSRGFIWMATDKGVARYNGVSFELFDTHDGLPDNEIFSFQEDYQHRIWMVAYSGVLCYYKNGVFHNPGNTPFLRLPLKPGHALRINLEKDGSITVCYKNLTYFINIKEDSCRIYPNGKVKGEVSSIVNIHKVSDSIYYVSNKNKTFLINVYTHAVGNKTFHQDRSCHIFQDQKYFFDTKYVYDRNYKVIHSIPLSLQKPVITINGLYSDGSGGEARLYISHNSKNAANPGGTGGVGYYTLAPLAFTIPFTVVLPPSGISATQFGFTEIERAKNGKLYMARNTSANYDFSTPGAVYSLELSGNWGNTPFTVTASDNTNFGAKCDKYYIQTQIDGENYDAGYYTVPSIVAGSSTVKGIVGSTTASGAPTIYRCGSEPLFYKANVSGLMKEYDYIIDAGPAANPIDGYIHASGTIISSANKIEMDMEGILPPEYVHTDWKITIIPKSACGTTGPAVTTYFKVRGATALSEFKKAGCDGNCGKPIQTTLPITTPAPTPNDDLPTFKTNIDATQGWVGAGTAGIYDINTNTTGSWTMRVYEVDPATGARMVRSGVTAPDIVLKNSTGPKLGYMRFNDISREFKPSNPPFYISDTAADGGFFSDYYNSARLGGTLAEFSSRVYCAELEVIETTSGCTALTRSFFKIANNGKKNGQNARPTGVDEYEETATAISIYPNPASTAITVKLPLNSGKAMLVLMDNTGRKVLENSSLHSGENKIDIKHLPSGIYFYKVSIDGKLQNGKLIKQ